MMAVMMLLLVSLSGRAQDIITMKKGVDVKAKVLEVLPNEIKYKQFENQDGPTFTVRKADILMVT